MMEFGFLKKKFAFAVGFIGLCSGRITIPRDGDIAEDRFSFLQKDISPRETDVPFLQDFTSGPVSIMPASRVSTIS